MLDLPEYCFCGCGKHFGKYDTANMEGFSVVFELGRWINFLSVMTHVGSDQDWTEYEEYMTEGAACYRTLLDEAHDGVKPDRKQRKATSRWLKQGKRARRYLGKRIPDDELNPFELELPNRATVRAWVMEGKLPAVQRLDPASLAGDGSPSKNEATLGIGQRSKEQ